MLAIRIYDVALVGIDARVHSAMDWLPEQIESNQRGDHG